MLTPKPVCSQNILGLRDQIQRAASVSIVGNIAEDLTGAATRSSSSFFRSQKALEKAEGVKSHLYVAMDQRYVGATQFDRLYNSADEVGPAKRWVYDLPETIRSARQEIQMIHSVHGLQPTVHGPVGDCLSFFGAGLQPLNWQLWSGNCGLATVDWRPWTADWSSVPFHFWSLVFFVFGCMVGSFLNVCIHRMPRGMSIVTPPRIVRTASTPSRGISMSRWSRGCSCGAGAKIAARRFRRVISSLNC